MTTSSKRWAPVVLCVFGTFNGVALAGETPSFQKTIQPMFDTYCVSCHMQGAAPEGLILQRGSSYGQLVEKQAKQSAFKLVDPGKPQTSYLLHKLTGEQLALGGKGAAMPFGQSRADPQLVEAVRSWISSGALDN